MGRFSARRRTNELRSVGGCDGDRGYFYFARSLDPGVTRTVESRIRSKMPTRDVVSFDARSMIKTIECVAGQSFGLNTVSPGSRT